MDSNKSELESDSEESDYENINVKKYEIQQTFDDIQYYIKSTLDDNNDRKRHKYILNELSLLWENMVETHRKDYAYKGNDRMGLLVKYMCDNCFSQDTIINSDVKSYENNSCDEGYCVQTINKDNKDNDDENDVNELLLKVSGTYTDRNRIELKYNSNTECFTIISLTSFRANGMGMNVNEKDISIDITEMEELKNIVKEIISGSFSNKFWNKYLNN